VGVSLQREWKGRKGEGEGRKIGWDEKGGEGRR